MTARKAAEAATEGVPEVSLLEATELGRRDLLVASRRHIAKTIEAGVPAHALARLMTEFQRIDFEIRSIDGTDDEEWEMTADEPFDPSTI